MTQHDNTKLLSSIQTQALNEIKQKVNQKFPIKDYILY
jgi:hypothetical protein